MSSHSERLELFDAGEQAVRKLERGWPGLGWIPSLREQIDYLRAIELGEEPDRSRLGGVNIGLITAREIEGLDVAAAELLHRISGVAREMDGR